VADQPVGTVLDEARLGPWVRHRSQGVSAAQGGHSGQGEGAAGRDEHPATGQAEDRSGSAPTARQRQAGSGDHCEDQELDGDPALAARTE
jgi:hypothetical protein